MELAGTAGHEKHIKMGRRCSFICFPAYQIQREHKK